MTEDRIEKFFKRDFILQYERHDRHTLTETMIVNPNPDAPLFAVRIGYLSSPPNATVHFLMRDHHPSHLADIANPRIVSWSRIRSPEGHIRMDEWLDDEIQKGTFYLPGDSYHRTHYWVGSFNPCEARDMEKLHEKMRLAEGRKLLTGNLELDAQLIDTVMQLAKNTESFSQKMRLSEGLKKFTPPLQSPPKKGGGRLL